MNLVSRQIFGNTSNLGFNTEIGGVSATISTPTLLATKLAIDVARISNFTVVGSDIKCRISGSYAIPFDAFLSNSSITYYIDKDNLVSSVGDSSFINSYLSGVVKFNGAITVGTDTFRKNDTTKNIVEFNAIHLANATTIGENTFFSCIKCLVFYIPRVTTLGNSVVSNGIFWECNSLAKIYAHPSLATNNGGAPDGDLAYAIARGATVRYVSNFTLPIAPTLTSIGTIYNTAAQINFTQTIGSTNAIEYYECWVDGVQKNNITASGQYVTNLPANTTQNITLVSVDIFLNRSVVSNSLSVTTSNYADSYYMETAESLLFKTNAVITGTANINAVDFIFFQLQNKSLYTEIQCFYPNIGTASQQKYNGKNPLDTNAAFRQTYFGSGTFSDLGYQLNGSNAYANTYFVPSVNQLQDSNGVTVVCGTNNTASSGDTYECGAYNSGTKNTVLSLKNNNSNYKKVMGLNGTYFNYSGVNESRGIFTATKQTGVLSKLFRNNVLLVSGNSGGTLPTLSLFIGSANVGSPYSYSSQRIQSVFFHSGLTDAKVAELYTITDTFENALGRKTW